MLHFCTLFDTNYLSRGLAMYRSLMNHCENFHLYIFAFNNAAYDILKKLDLEKVTVVSLQEFEDPDLLAIKPTRNIAEYCWTCTSSTVLYCIEKYQLDHCTYLDADLYFFNNPEALVAEMGENDVLITEHHYTTETEESKLAGKYCVQFITFKNTEKGMKVLRYWRNACIEWCFDRYEDGKFGDQKYLDDWTTRFEGVHVLQHLGGGVAPWNIEQFDVFFQGKSLSMKEKSTEKVYPVIFYHFHYLKFYQKNVVDLGVYKYAPADVDLIYTPYIKEIENIYQDLKKKGISIPYKIKKGSYHSLRMIMLKFRRKRNGMKTYKMKNFLA